MTTHIDALLQRLDGVTSDSRGKNGITYHAFCPCCNKAARKLAVTVTSDQRVLISCFANCSVADVLSAIDLVFQTFSPPPTSQVASVGGRSFASDARSNCARRSNASFSRCNSAERCRLFAVRKMRWKWNNMPAPPESDRLIRKSRQCICTSD